MVRVVPWGWPDLHGFGDMVRGIEVEGEEHDEHDEHEEGESGYIDTNARTHAFRLLPRARITHPNPIKPQEKTQR